MGISQKLGKTFDVHPWVEFWSSGFKVEVLHMAGLFSVASSINVRDEVIGTTQLALFRSFHCFGRRFWKLAVFIVF
jgi:hypothetical protein